MFDGERAQPEQRVSLLLRINPRRYDAALVPSIHRLLRGAAAERGRRRRRRPSIRSAGCCASPISSARWRDAARRSAPGLDGAHAALLGSMNEQHATLQRMLYDAGVTHDQLGALGDDVEADTACGSSSGRSPRSCSGSCTSAANQLQRRWHATEPALPHPPRARRLVRGVASLDEPRPRR